MYDLFKQQFGFHQSFGTLLSKDGGLVAQQSLKGTALPRGLCHSLALSLATVLCSWPANQPTHLQLLNSLSGYTLNTFLDFHQPFLAPRI